VVATRFNSLHGSCTYSNAATLGLSRNLGNRRSGNLSVRARYGGSTLLNRALSPVRVVHFGA
jgi:hypothetical protein